MQWPMPWLEALGLLAVVFAAGNGIGFGLSRLSGPRTLGKTRPARRPQPEPAEAAPLAPERAAIAAPLPTAEARIADSPTPVAVVTAPALPSPPQVAFTMRVRYPVNPFGALSVTRPNPDQPSS